MKNGFCRKVERWFWVVLYRLTGNVEYSWRGRYCKHCGCDLEPIEPDICMDCYYGGHE